jgi:hypothetical protein
MSSGEPVLGMGLYDPGVNLLVSGQGNSERYVGSQPSVGIYWKASRHISVCLLRMLIFSGHSW